MKLTIKRMHLDALIRNVCFGEVSNVKDDALFIKVSDMHLTLRISNIKMKTEVRIMLHQEQVELAMPGRLWVRCIDLYEWLQGPEFGAKAPPGNMVTLEYNANAEKLILTSEGVTYYLRASHISPGNLRKVFIPRTTVAPVKVLADVLDFKQPS